MNDNADVYKGRMMTTMSLPLDDEGDQHRTVPAFVLGMR